MSARPKRPRSGRHDRRSGSAGDCRESLIWIANGNGRGAGWALGDSKAIQRKLQPSCISC